jgi:methyl-accepting chemotaxis protein
MAFLRKFTIRKRFILLLAFIIASLVTLSSISLFQGYQSLLQQKYTANQQLVETAYGVVEHFHQQQNDGLLNEEEAQKRAIEVLTSLRYDNTNYFWINDYTATMIMHPIKPSLIGKNLSGLKDIDGTTFFQDMVNVATEKGEGFVPYKWPKPGVDDPVKKISYVKGFTSWQWIIGSGTYLDDVDVTFSSQRNILLASAIIVVLIIILLGYLIGKSIIVPTNEASNLMKDISQGEGDLTRVLDDNAQDEISRLAHYFNEFTKKMRDSLGDVANNSNIVLSHAQSVADSSESAQSLTQNQNDITTQVATAMEQMTSQIHDVSSNANAAEQAANDARNNTNQGKEIISSTIDQMQSLSTNIDDVSQVVASLAAESDNIGSVLDVIRGIAEQTNLLALNAAIEAARAGEQGRGFAVVADEVRALAAKTADATHQIGEMLNQISNETSETTSVMTTIVQQTNSVVNTMTDLSLSLADIDQLMADSSAASDQISHALQEQDLAAAEISTSVISLHDFLVDKSSETRNVSTQAQTLSNSTESIFVHLSEFDSNTLINRMCKQAELAAKKVAELFEKSIANKDITQLKLFDFNYKPLGNSEPQKFTTSFDDFTDKNLPAIQEPLLEEFNEMIYAGAVDINGYFPTHNKCFAKPLTGNPEVDMVNNRTKRLFNDPTGIRCAQHTDKFLLQTYKRDTGEIMHDVSAPIFVQGKHWGGFRIGFNAK